MTGAVGAAIVPLDIGAHGHYAREHDNSSDRHDHFNVAMNARDVASHIGRGLALDAECVRQGSKLTKVPASDH